MIPAQPGKRDLRFRKADARWLVYRFDPTLITAMQWEIIRIFKNEAEARAFAFPYRAKLSAAA